MNFKKIFKSDIYIFILFLLIFYGIFRYTGSFNHGYDITEDHAFFSTNQSLESNSFTAVFEQKMKAELKALKRFRPVWVFYIISTVELFGINLLLINIYIVFLCICTSFLLYKFCLNIGFTTLQSFLFALITMIGPATIMYSRPPDAEIMGMLLLSFTLFILSKSIYSQKHQLFYKSVFIIFLILTSLCKESFLILTPAILFLYAFIYSLKNNIGIIHSFKKNYIMIILASVFSLAILITIVKLIGINQDRSYSGVDINLFSGKTIIDFAQTVFKTNIVFVVLFGIFVYFENELQSHKISSDHIKKHLIRILQVFILMLLVILPQLILYYKTGFLGRYYLPFYLGFSFFSVFLLNRIFESKSVSTFVKYLYLVVIIIYLFLMVKTETIPSITFFAERCRATSNALNSIMSDKDDDLLLVFDPIVNFWDIYSLDLYLDNFNKRKNYKYDFVRVDKLGILFSDTVFLNKSINTSKTFFDNNQFRIIDSTKKYTDINDILVFENLDSKFKYKNRGWFEEEKYNREQFGRYTFYSKK